MSHGVSHYIVAYLLYYIFLNSIYHPFISFIYLHIYLLLTCIATQHNFVNFVFHNSNN